MQRQHSSQAISTLGNSDVSESFVSSQSRVRVTSPRVRVESGSSKYFSSLVRVITWSSRVRVDSRELSSHLESLVCKLESMSSHTKFHVFSTFFAVKWRPIG